MWEDEEGTCSDDGVMEVQERETPVCDAGTTSLWGGVIGSLLGDLLQELGV